MRFVIGVVALIAVAFPALAQQRQATPAEQLQALNGKLQDEINQDMQVRQVLAQANSTIIDLQKQVDDLKAKYEPKKPELDTKP